MEKLLTDDQIKEIYKDSRDNTPEQMELLFQKVKQEHNKLNNI